MIIEDQTAVDEVAWVNETTIEAAEAAGVPNEEISPAPVVELEHVEPIMLALSHVAVHGMSTNQAEVSLPLQNLGPVNATEPVKKRR